MAQFVEWSATMAELVTGVDILAGLDESRFTKVAIAMGFGDYVSQLYKDVSLNRNGEIGGLLGDNERLNQEQLRTMREFLLAMGWDSTSDAESSNIDTTGWSFGGTDVESVRLSLRELFKRHGIKISQLFEKLDENDDNLLSKAEFTEGLLGPLGFKTTRALDDCFLDVDDDGDGVVTFGEMHGWVRAAVVEKQRLAAARTLRLPRSGLSHGMRIVCAGSSTPVSRPPASRWLTCWAHGMRTRAGTYAKRSGWFSSNGCARTHRIWCGTARYATPSPTPLTRSIETAKGSCRFRKSRLGSRPRMRRTRRTPPPPRSHAAPEQGARAGRCEAAQSGASDSIERHSERSNARTMRTVEVARALRAQMTGFKATRKAWLPRRPPIA